MRVLTDLQINDKAVALLERAAVFVGIGWTQGAAARNAASAPVSATATEAVCWCATGALLIASYRVGLLKLSGGDETAVRRAAKDALEKLIRGYTGLTPDRGGLIAYWNDLDGQRQANVKDALIRAARTLKPLTEAC